MKGATGMPDPAKMRPLARLANLVGILIALAALGVLGRYAMLLVQAMQGHSRLVG